MPTSIGCSQDTSKADVLQASVHCTQDFVLQVDVNQAIHSHKRGKFGREMHAKTTLINIIEVVFSDYSSVC